MITMSMPISRRSLARLGAMAAVAVSLLAGGAAVAEAGCVGQGCVNVYDSFESNPASRWTFDRAGSGATGFFETYGTARTGSTNAMVSTTGPGNWSGVKRTVTIPGGSYRCDARVWVKSLYANASIRFEVIDPKTWTYISLKTVTIAKSSSYVALDHSWAPKQFSTFVVRVTLKDSATRLRVDDLDIGCLYVY
jgi:hypothetical protein